MLEISYFTMPFNNQIVIWLLHLFTHSAMYASSIHLQLNVLYMRVGYLLCMPDI